MYRPFRCGRRPGKHTEDLTENWTTLPVRKSCTSLLQDSRLKIPPASDRDGSDARGAVGVGRTGLHMPSILYAR